MSLRSLHITKADSVVLLGMLCCVKVLTRSLRQPKGIIKDRRWRQKNGKQIPLFGVISSHWISFSHFLSRSLLTFLPKYTVGMWHAIKSICKRSSAEQKPCDVLLIPTLAFDYSTIILYLSKLERKGRLNNPVIHDTLAALKPQCKMCFSCSEHKLAYSWFGLFFLSNGVISSKPSISKLLAK